MDKNCTDDSAIFMAAMFFIVCIVCPFFCCAYGFLRACCDKCSRSQTNVENPGTELTESEKKNAEQKGPVGVASGLTLAERNPEPIGE